MEPIFKWCELYRSIISTAVSPAGYLTLWRLHIFIMLWHRYETQASNDQMMQLCIHMYIYTLCKLGPYSFCVFPQLSTRCIKAIRLLASKSPPKHFTSGPSGTPGNEVNGAGLVTRIHLSATLTGIFKTIVVTQC